MAIPTNFNSWEHLQSVLIKTHNKTVREFFRQDLEDDDITTPEGAVRKACLIDDNDTASICITKILFFALDCGWLEHLLRKVFYGIPKTDFYEINNVQLILTFIEKKPYHQERTNPKRKQITLNLNTQIDDINDSFIHSLKTIINRLLPPTYKYYCGELDFSYYDKKNNVKLFLPAENEAEAIKFIKKVLDIINVSFDEHFLRRHQNTNQRLTSPKIRILGKQYNKYRLRAMGYVVLDQAILEIGNYESLVLVDRI